MTKKTMTTQNEIPTARSLPSPAELAACIDATGVLQLGKLHGLCMESLRSIEANGYGSGNKSRSRSGLRRRVRILLEQHFEVTFARAWFQDQVWPSWELEL